MLVKKKIKNHAIIPIDSSHHLALVLLKFDLTDILSIKCASSGLTSAGQVFVLSVYIPRPSSLSWSPSIGWKIYQSTNDSSIVQALCSIFAA